MKTLAEEYVFKLLIEANIFTRKTGYGKDENETTRQGKYWLARGVGSNAAVAGGNAAAGAAGLGSLGAIGGSTAVLGTALGGAGVATAAYYLYRKHKKAKMQADMEKDPAKKLKLNAQANQLKQDANKKKVENQKKQRLQKHAQELQKQTMQKQAQINQ